MALSLSKAGTASAESIAALVARYGDLPDEYRDFLASYDGVVPPDNVVHREGNEIGVRSFIAASEVLKTARAVACLPQGLMPVADDDCGNLFCINITDRTIEFWDHETGVSEEVAQSFGEFLLRLIPFDMGQANLAPRQVRRVWVDPDFKPEFD